MADPTEEIFKFVLSLPLSINPYKAVATKIRHLTQVPTPPLWGRILRRIIAVQFCILCGQCITVLFLRKKANRLKFFRLNKLGLIQIEVLNEIVLFMLIFSAVAVVDLVTQELVELDLIQFSSKLVLRTSKFSITAVVCWFFLWICSIEAIMSHTSLRAQARAGTSIKLSFWVRFIANGSMLAVVTVPSAFILWVSIRTALDMKAIEIASREILTGLHQEAPKYRPETYNVMKLFVILKPGQVFAIHTNHLANDAKLMLFLYLVLQLVATALYIPTSVLALRGLRKQTAPPTTKNYGDAQMSNFQTPVMKLMNDGPTRERAALESVRKRLIKHSYLLYLDTILYCPLLCYMLTYKGTSFFNDTTWMILEQLGTHVHTAIIGNIILALLIQNTLYTTRTSIPQFDAVGEKPSSYVRLQRETKDTKVDFQMTSLV